MTRDALDGIAIIGMAGRFPQAPTLQRFWENLRQSFSGFAAKPGGAIDTDRPWSPPSWCWYWSAIVGSAALRGRRATVANIDRRAEVIPGKG